MLTFLVHDQAFSPTEPLKAGDALSRQNIPFNIGETRMSLPTTYQELVEVYQVMQLLFENSVSFSLLIFLVKRLLICLMPLIAFLLSGI